MNSKSFRSPPSPSTRLRYPSINIFDLVDTVTESTEFNPSKVAHYTILIPVLLLIHLRTCLTTARMRLPEIPSSTRSAATEKTPSSEMSQQPPPTQITANIPQPEHGNLCIRPPSKYVWNTPAGPKPQSVLNRSRRHFVAGLPTCHNLRLRSRTGTGALLEQSEQPICKPRSVTENPKAFRRKGKSRSRSDPAGVAWAMEKNRVEAISKSLGSRAEQLSEDEWNSMLKVKQKLERLRSKYGLDEDGGEEEWKRMWASIEWKQERRRKKAILNRWRRSRLSGSEEKIEASSGDMSLRASADVQTDKENRQPLTEITNRFLPKPLKKRKPLEPILSCVNSIASPQDITEKASNQSESSVSKARIMSSTPKPRKDRWGWTAAGWHKI